MCIIMIIVFFIIILLFFFIYKQKKVEMIKNYKKYSFLEIIHNWGYIYNNLYFNNKKLITFNNKYNTYLLSKKLNVKVPKMYYYGLYKDMNKEILNKKNFVIKPLNGHSSQNVLLINNKLNLFNNKTYNINNFNRIFKNSFVIVEEFLKDKNGKYNIPDDFKFFVFKGNPELILHKVYKNNKYKKTWYDSNWNKLKLPISSNNITGPGPSIPKPKGFNDMINICKKIGKTVFKDVFVRLDFYLDNNIPTFGEITPHPLAGKGFTKEGLVVLDKLCKKHDLHIDNYKL